MLFIIKMTKIAIAQLDLELASRYGFYCYFTDKKIVKVTYF